MPTALGYRLAVRLGTAAVPAFGLVHAKTRAGHHGRRGAIQRLQAWGTAHRAPSRPLIWFHASSVGEGLQAESILTRLRALHAHCQIVYTHFSPSAKALAQRVGADVHDYLPYDTPAAADALLDALQPDILAFSKLDLWPELATRAAARGTAVSLIAATVSPGSGRLRWPVRALLSPGYEAVTHAAVVSDADASRLALLGVAPARMEVLGDPRYDSVAARVHAIAPDDPLLRLGGRTALVAGSTWPQDEAVLIEAFAHVRQRHPDARLIIVPHEPTPEHLAHVEGLAAAHGLPAPVRLSSVSSSVPLLLVDRVGVLAALYGAGGAAYVGGGYGSAGLHSVLEPAAWSIPVVFGPRWQNSRDAELLRHAQAAVALEGGDAGAGTLAQHWAEWLENDSARQAMGRRARAVVESGLGAADRTTTSLLRLLRTSPSGGRRVPA